MQNIQQMTEAARNALQGLTSMIYKIMGMDAVPVAANLAGDFQNLEAALAFVATYATNSMNELRQVIGPDKQLPAGKDVTDQIELTTSQQAGTALGRFDVEGQIIEDGDRNPVTPVAATAGTNGRKGRGRK